jgi:hypothetical protein
MAHTFLIFDFGTDEETAQQARHKVEGWKQGFRLGNKIMLKFDREETPEADDSAALKDLAEESETKAKGRAHGKSGAKSEKSSKGSKSNSADENGRVRVLLRLDFSDHEKLSHQRWLDRIPSEDPFKSARGETLRPGDADFAKTSELWETLS